MTRAAKRLSSRPPRQPKEIFDLRESGRGWNPRKLRIYGSYPIRGFGTTPARLVCWELSKGRFSLLMKRRLRDSVFVHLSRFALVAVTLIAACGTAQGQAAAEHAGATSVSATTAASEKSVMVPAPSKPAAPKGSLHLVIHSGPPPEVVNRRALEQNAGENASKMLLRSTPSQAQVWIDGKFVGNTPLLLIVAPGNTKWKCADSGSRLPGRPWIFCRARRATLHFGWRFGTLQQFRFTKARLHREPER